MENANSILPLIKEWETYLANTDQPSIEDFAHWILLKKKYKTTKLPVEKMDSSNVLLAINRVHRLILMRTKPLVKATGFVNEFEFTILAHIYLMKTPNKTEVAEAVLLENSTTVEITKRLKKAKLIKEVTDNRDKRSTRLAVTEPGYKKLVKTYESLKEFHSGFLEGLTDKEQFELKRLLSILDKSETTKLKQQVS